MSKKVSPKKIYEYLNIHIVGQDAAKKAVSNAIFLHYVRTFQSIQQDKVLKKSNMILIGPSGSGKTLLIRRASEALGSITGLAIAPVLEVDCTSLTARGWEGDDLTELLKGHAKDHNGAGHIFNSSIIFFDEFDKLCVPAIGKGGDHNRNTQYNLLKIVEGTLIPRKNKKGLDTSKMLFIFAGNFPQIRHKRVSDKKSIGFTNPSSSKGSLDLFEELQNCGMITQLLGRVSYAAELLPLDRTILKKILTDHLLPEIGGTLDYMGYELNISRYFVNKIVEQAISNGTGARGLQAGLDKVLEDEIFTMEF